jgi:hypothetical protein
MEPEETVQVERTSLIRLYGAKVLVDPTKHRGLTYLDVKLKKHGDLPMKEQRRAKGIRNR